MGRRGRTCTWLLAIAPLAAALSLPGGPAGAADKSAVGPSAISLPSGPGSIEGLGESFQPTLNTGTASYRVSLKLPPGTAGHAPALALSYEGGAGNGPLGLGWRLGLPYVQRQADKGVPRYVDAADGADDDRDGVTDNPEELDRFINELKEELVPRADGYWFCENEGAFLRYRRAGEHWEAHRPDGTLLEFGLTAEGRVAEGGRVFAWLLERETDTHGNTVTYRYRSFEGDANAGQRYVDRIAYGPGAPPWAAFHFASFAYEDRPDRFEDCRAGFPVRTGKRLREIAVGTQGVSLPGHAAGDFDGDGQGDFLNRRYLMAYGAHPHWSLLSSVTLVGADGTSTLPPAIFGYTIADPPASVSAAGKVIGSLGTPPLVMDSGLVDLADLDGDALPDLLRTDPAGGPHRAYLNRGEVADAGGKAIRWAPGVEVGGDPRAWNVDLAESGGEVAHLADLDGDGLADLAYTTADATYYFPNLATAAWGPRALMNPDPREPRPPSPYAVAHVKTADLDFDKRMDVIQSVESGSGADYRIWFNLGRQRFARSVTVPQATGFLLGATGVHLADWNGDRLIDVVRVRPTGIQVTAGLGYGRFLPLRTVPFPDVVLDDIQVAAARLQDVDGDGLADLVLERAAPGQLWYWLNRGNDTVSPRRAVTGMPTAVGTAPEVRWADVNGNGTTDLVYADAEASPTLQIVDIGELIGAVPAPNLLLRMANGIGRVTTLEYATSCQYALADAAAGDPWPHPLPFPVQVVARALVDDSMGNRYVTEFSYHDGYYDGAEKEFRGFARVEQREVGDETAPDLVTAHVFDTGASREPLKGKLLSLETRTLAGEVFYRDQQAWETRVLAASASGDGREVTFAFQTGKTRDVIEKGSGPPVRLVWEYEVDDFGNVTRQFEHGRTDGDWDDERVTITEYTASYDSGRLSWILRKPVEETTEDEAGVRAGHRRHYYDGENALGAVTQGLLTRTDGWVAGEEYIPTIRNDYDSFGNITATYDPLYGQQPGHYRALVWDENFRTFPIQEIIYTGNPTVSTLRFYAEYDQGLAVMVASTSLSGFRTIYRHDSFGRLVSVTKPPDDGPTTEYEYVTAHPLDGNRSINWVESRHRDGSPGDGFLHSRAYIDGLGRTLFTRAEAAESGMALVTGATICDARGFPWREYLPYFEAGGLGYTESSTGGGFTERRYDEMGRSVRVDQPVVGGTASYSTREYPPLSMIVRDEEQTNPASSHHGSYRRFVEDGLQGEEGRGRLRALYETVHLDDEGNDLPYTVVWSTTYEFDLLGNIVEVRDFQGNRRSFQYDGLGRKTRVLDPDRGVIGFTYDAASNVVETTDARGQHVVYGYDGVNRLLWEDYEDEGMPHSANRSPDVTRHYDLPAGPVPFGNGLSWTTKNTLGLLAWVSDLSGEEHFSYDERGRSAWIVKRIQDPETALMTSYRTARTYDSMDRISVLEFPDGDRIRYSYDARGFLAQIAGGSGEVIATDFAYHATGQLERVAYANGVSRVREFDSRARLAHSTTFAMNDVTRPIIDYAYAYDAVGNILRIDDLRPETTVAADDPRRNSQRFQYDDLYRLTEVLYPRASSSEVGTIAYRYDRIGNMISKVSNIDQKRNGFSVTNIGSMTYGGSAGNWNRARRSPGDPPGPNALTATDNGVDQRQILYDANGNVTSLEGSTFSLDFKDRLVGVTNEASTAEYVYDHAGQRTIRRMSGAVSPVSVYLVDKVPFEYSIYINPYFEVHSGQAHKYVYAGPNRIAGGTGSFDPTAFRIQRVRLYEGWNLVAVCVSGDTALANFPAVDQIFRWDENSRAWLPMDRSSPLQQGMLLWLHANAPSLLTAKGLQESWTHPSVVERSGYLGNVELGAAYLRNPTDPGISIWSWDARNQKWRGHLGGNLSALSPAPREIAGGEVLFLSLPSNAVTPNPMSERATELLYYHQDHLGSTSLVTDRGGAIQAEIAYLPFGERRVSEQKHPALPIRYDFTGAQRDGETGNIMMGARFYAPPLGRFLSVDPLVLDASATLGQVDVSSAYAYSANNPLKYSDPTGLATYSRDQQGYLIATVHRHTVRGKEDWTSKIAKDLTGDPSKYREVLEPTAATLQRAGVKDVKDFNWDLVYEGDTFRVKGSKSEMRMSGLQGKGPVTTYDPQEGTPPALRYKKVPQLDCQGPACGTDTVPELELPDANTFGFDPCANGNSPACIAKKIIESPITRDVVKGNVCLWKGCTDVTGADDRDKRLGGQEDLGEVIIPGPQFSF